MPTERTLAVITGLLAFGGTSFIYVFLRALQQLNVQHEKRLAIIPSSCGMAACEFFLITSTVHLNTLWVIPCGGIGAGVGALTAMVIHKWLREKYA